MEVANIQLSFKNAPVYKSQAGVICLKLITIVKINFRKLRERKQFFKLDICINLFWVLLYLDLFL